MISGKYLGEVVRQVCLTLIKMGALFGGKSSETFDSRDNFKTSFVSDIEAGCVHRPWVGMQPMSDDLDTLGVQLVHAVCYCVCVRRVQYICAGVGWP